MIVKQTEWLYLHDCKTKPIGYIYVTFKATPIDCIYMIHNHYATVQLSKNYAEKRKWLVISDL